MRLALPVIVLCACGASKAPAHFDAAATTDECATLAAKVEVLYQAAAKASATTGDLADDLVRANTHMVMKECDAEPTKVVPCIKAATSAEDLEDQCLSPLDDRGEVEAAQFR